MGSEGAGELLGPGEAAIGGAAKPLVLMLDPLEDQSKKLRVACVPFDVCRVRGDAARPFKPHLVFRRSNCRRGVGRGDIKISHLVRAHLAADKLPRSRLTVLVLNNGRRRWFSQSMREGWK